MLDTNVLIWSFADARQLSREQLRVVEECERKREPIGVAAITLWEVAWLERRRRIRKSFDVPDLLSAIEDNELFEIFPVDFRVARAAALLGDGFPKDPADRLIAATALVHGLKLVTGDDAIRESGAVEVV
jgi:PIN domain nuclease of toxin-antitoxin system